MHFYWMALIVVIHYNYNFIIITVLTAHLVLTSGWNKSTLVTDLHLYTGKLATFTFYLCLHYKRSANCQGLLLIQVNNISSLKWDIPS